MLHPRCQEPLTVHHFSPQSVPKVQRESGAKGINLNYGANQGNGGKDTAHITSVTATTVSGNNAFTVAVGDTVEVFSNSAGNCIDAAVFLDHDDTVIVGLTIFPLPQNRDRTCPLREHQRWHEAVMK